MIRLDLFIKLSDLVRQLPGIPSGTRLIHGLQSLQELFVIDPAVAVVVCVGVGVNSARYSGFGVNRPAYLIASLTW
jgi:hypothetical protein